MTRILIVLLALGCLAGCDKHAIRDANTYKVELLQWDSWATKQADLLEGFIARNCTCIEVPAPTSIVPGTTGTDPVEHQVGKRFSTPECEQAADYVLTVKARHEWHMQMALYNGGLREDRPSKTPPTIPESFILCPAPAVEGGK